MERVRPSITENSDITMYSHALSKDVTSYTQTNLEYGQPVFRFRHCLSTEHGCDNMIMVFDGTRKRKNMPFIAITNAEVAFGAIPNHGYGMGYNSAYLLALDGVNLDKEYTIAELRDLYCKDLILVAYGGISEVHRAHLMTEEVYDSYDKVGWCEGGCGGCEDNWDYVDPWSVKGIFPTYRDMAAHMLKILENVMPSLLKTNESKDIQ